MKKGLGDKIEKKLSKYAIPNLSFYMIVCFAVGYILDILSKGRIIGYLTLEPIYIFHGQIWRIISWVLTPPRESSILFVMISLYFYYSIGKTLEMVWGEYRYNVYIFSGLFFTIIGAFIVYFILSFVGINSASFSEIMYLFSGAKTNPFSTFYVCMSIFLAFAVTFPEMEVMLMFIIPIKVKVLGIIYAIIMVIECIQYVFYYGLLGLLLYSIPMVASLLNFIIFFFSGKKRIGITRAQQAERKQFRAKVKDASRNVSRHKCAICGRTDESHPDLEFRFCSKCNGNYEYCQDHLFTHNHIK